MTWITPFKKQCFVTCGVVMNIAGFGLVIGYTTSLLKQLRLPDSYITIDDSTAGWIASIIGLAMLPSSLITPLIMGRYGRKVASVVSLIPTIVSWFMVIAAKSSTTLLIARCFQGLTLGMISIIAPILIGEYTSPRNRGMFLTMISLAICIGTVIAHTLGLYLTWQNTALVFAFLAFVNLIIVLYSPESPAWLIDRGRIEESKKAFRWLRGNGEEEELNAIIAANAALKKKKDVTDDSLPVETRCQYWKKTIKKREFFKPLLLVIVLYILNYWGGGIIIAAYIIDIVEDIMGKGVDGTFIIISSGVQRIFTTLLASYVVKKVKRRTLLNYGGALNISILILTGCYVYFKSKGMLPFDNSAIGFTLIHIHLFSLAISTMTVPVILAGELFPLEYRNISSAISVLTNTPNMMLVLKTYPLLHSSVGLHGTYFVYAGVLGACSFVLWLFLPETKDRTLQDIENEFRGITKSDENAAEPLTLIVEKDNGTNNPCNF